MSRIKEAEGVVNMAQFQFKCPQCGKEVTADETMRGMVAECPYCEKGIVVPRNTSAEKVTSRPSHLGLRRNPTLGHTAAAVPRQFQNPQSIESETMLQQASPSSGPGEITRRKKRVRTWLYALISIGILSLLAAVLCVVTKGQKDIESVVADSRQQGKVEFDATTGLGDFCIEKQYAASPQSGVAYRNGGGMFGVKVFQAIKGGALCTLNVPPGIYNIETRNIFVKTKRAYTDGDRLAGQWFRNIGNFTYTTTVGGSSTVFAFEELEGKELELVNEAVTAAKLKTPNGQYEKGRSLAKGIGVKTNLTEAIKWYTMAAEQGHTAAQLELAQAYDQGLGVETNKVEAVKWYHKAAEDGEAFAQNKMGECYEYGLAGTKKDLAEAEKWYRGAAKGGIVTAQFKLAEMMVERAYKIASEKGDDDDEYEIKKRREKVRRLCNEVDKLYQSAANEGHKEAQYSYVLFKMFDTSSFERNHERPELELFKNAAQGRPYAWELLGACLINPEFDEDFKSMLRVDSFDLYHYDITKTDEEKGYDPFLILKKAAKGENAIAARSLALIYDSSAKDWEKQMKDEAAAKERRLSRGSRRGRFALQVENDNTEVEKPKNEMTVKAVKWYGEAAKHGDPIALCKLAQCHSNGVGFEMCDDEEALKLYRKAVELGKTMLDRDTVKLEAERMSAMEKIAWQKLHLMVIQGAVTYAQNHAKELEKNVMAIRADPYYRKTNKEADEKRQRELARRITCTECNGSGKGKGKCGQCGGSGSVLDGTCSSCEGKGTVSEEKECVRCKGTGEVKKFCERCKGKELVKCPTCRGYGTISVTGALRRRTCDACDGRRQIACPNCCNTFSGNNMEKCRRCSGTGKTMVKVKCSECNGSGKGKRTCPSCEGKGGVPCGMCKGIGFTYKDEPSAGHENGSSSHGSHPAER